MEQAQHQCQALPLCAMSTLADYHNAFFKQGNQQTQKIASTEENNNNLITDIDHSLKHLVLTGHSDGKVLVWRLGGYIDVLIDYRIPVNVMTKCYEGIAIGVADGNIYIWDVNLIAESKVIDIHAFKFEVLSSIIVSLDYN